MAKGLPVSGQNMGEEVNWDPSHYAPGEALLASGRIWFLEFSFAQIPYVLSIASGIKGEVFQENWYQDSHLNNAVCERRGQSKGKYFKKKEKLILF